MLQLNSSDVTLQSPEEQLQAVPAGEFTVHFNEQSLIVENIDSEH